MTRDTNKPRCNASLFADSKSTCALVEGHAGDHVDGGGGGWANRDDIVDRLMRASGLSKPPNLITDAAKAIRELRGVVKHHEREIASRNESIDRLCQERDEREKQLDPESIQHWDSMLKTRNAAQAAACRLGNEHAHVLGILRDIPGWVQELKRLGEREAEIIANDLTARIEAAKPPTTPPSTRDTDEHSGWHPLDSAPEKILVLLLVDTGMVHYDRAVITGYFDDEYRPPLKDLRRWLDTHNRPLSDSGTSPLAWLPLTTLPGFEPCKS